MGRKRSLHSASTNPSSVKNNNRNTDSSSEDDCWILQDGKKVRLSREEQHLLKSSCCEVCGGLTSFEGNNILLCDGSASTCNKGYHQKCLKPPLNDEPEGDFIGPCCDASKRLTQGSLAGRGQLRRLRHRNEQQENDPGLFPQINFMRRFSDSNQKRASSLIECFDDVLIPRHVSNYASAHSSAACSTDDPSPVANSSDWYQSLRQSHEKLLSDLEGIVGMERIKELLIEMNSKIYLRKERVRRSLAASCSEDGRDSTVGSGIAPHIVLIGNPGTGKSMIGKILAKILHRSNAVKRNVLIKAHRSDLVAGYLGQTALKTAQLIEQARGGIMFIDEAHQLINPNKEDYGIEAYRQIMKEMLNEHVVDEDRVTFIFAGYPKQMNRFLSHDAGMESRISFRIHLPDYSLDEIATICRTKLHNRDPKEGLPCKVDPDVDIANILSSLPRELVPKYNARIADLLLDKAEASLARRVLLQPPNSLVVDISSLAESDIRHAVGILRKEMEQACLVESPDSESSASSINHI
jgi:Holliday junction resolvasome RuvABC ATP-dependent DNA helicase subunit